MYYLFFKNLFLFTRASNVRSVSKHFRFYISRLAMGVNVCCPMKVKTYQVMSFLQTMYLDISEFQKTIVQNSHDQLGVCCRQVPVW